MKINLFNIVLAIIAYCLSSPSSAETDIKQEELLKCRDIKVALQRLSCFDKAVDTPNYNKEIIITNANPPQPPKPQSKSSVEIVSDQLESNREENDYSWQILQQPEADRPDQTLIVMSKPAIGKIGIQHRLIISCIDNITRLQILLPNDSATLRADVSLRDNNDHELLSGTWRIVSNNLVGPGLGLESIGIIRKLFNQAVVKVASKNSNLDGLFFDLTDLATASAPLQKACHWSR